MSATPSNVEPMALSVSAGGTLYSLSPNGTRIAYDRRQLLTLAKSPLSRSPGILLPRIPGVTVAQELPVEVPSSPGSASDVGESDSGEDNNVFEIE